MKYPLLLNNINFSKNPLKNFFSFKQLFSHLNKYMSHETHIGEIT